MTSAPVFISYSHRDRRWLKDLQVHLKPYIRNRSFAIWDDTRIAPGTHWREEIEQALNAASVAILLVSPDFLASDFIYNEELGPLLEAAKSRGLGIGWIAVSASAYEQTYLKDLQALNHLSQPLDTLDRPERNKEWVKIGKRVKEMVEGTRAQAGPQPADAKSREGATGDHAVASHAITRPPTESPPVEDSPAVPVTTSNGVEAPDPPRPDLPPSVTQPESQEPATASRGTKQEPLPPDTPASPPTRAVAPTPESVELPKRHARRITSDNVDALRRSYNLAGHQASVRGIAFSPDGRTVASGSVDWTVRFWSVAEGTPLDTWEKHQAPVSSVAFTPDGAAVAFGARARIHLRRVAGGDSPRAFSGHGGDVLSVAVSPDGRTLASGSADKTVRLWRLTDGALLHVFGEHAGAVTSVAFSPDGQMLASGAADGGLRLWRVADGHLVRSMGVNVGGFTSLMWNMISGSEFKAVFSVAFGADDRTTAAAYGNGTIFLRHLNDSGPPRTLDLQANFQAVFSVAFSPDGQTLAAGCQDQAIRLWSVADGRLLVTLQGHPGSVRCVAFSPDGTTLAAGADDGAVILWRA